MQNYKTLPKHSQQSGFSLIEIAIGLVIIGLVLGSLITPLSTLRETGKRNDAKKILNDIHDAVIGFAINNNGRLPCPATTTSNGLEALSGSNCTLEHGFLPAASLGLRGSYENSLLLDPWNNPYRYSHDTAASYQICIQNNCPNAASIIASNIPAVIFTTGSDGATVTTSVDQLENIDGDSNFVQQTPRDGTTTAFNDQIQWVSPHTLTLYLSR